MDLVMLVIAFGGGLFGALIGALPAFIFTGITGLIGVAVIAAGGTIDILGTVAFGPFFGPHISFAGGVAAAAFAHRKGNLEAGGNILKPLASLSDPIVLIVGGGFGVLGYLVNFLYADILALPTDTIAMTVITSAIVARLAFGRTGIMGKCENEKRVLFPGFSQIWFLAVIGAGSGALAAYYSVTTGLVVLGFCVSATSLIFTQMGHGVPATHHMTLIAALAASVTGNIWVGILFGAIAAIIGEVVQRTFNSYCDSHIDPPAFAIFTCAFVILLFL